MELINIKKKNLGLSLTTFRGNISKLNKKIREELNNKTISDTFEIAIEGRRGAKFYYLKIPKGKIVIKK
ncbi:MAG: hypothetical protein JXA68_09575 [Ignavibacteriales bacterium]|nr:hypothetical protein [Ignavibacteriales bacterium]